MRQVFRVVLVLVLLGVVGAVVYMQPRLSEAERGRRLAEGMGCVGCHGPEATHGVMNLGDRDPVPGFGGGVLMMDTPKGSPDVRDWILEGTVGMDRRKAGEWQKAHPGEAPRAHDRKPPALEMPAYKGRLSPRQLEDLVAFVMTQDGWGLDQATPAVREGAEVARKSGCFGCHGPLGLFARPNPGSLKGYIPSWRGPDAGELVASDAEFAEWVRDGRAHRFDANPAAKFFLDRESTRMPSFKDHLTDAQIASIDSLYRWVRAGNPKLDQPAPKGAGGEGGEDGAPAESAAAGVAGK